MELPEKVTHRPTKNTKKLRGKNCYWNPFWFFLLLSCFPALFLTITFCLLGIKTIFWSERGTFRHPLIRGYIAVFFFLLLCITFLLALLYVLHFLLKSMLQKKDRSEQKKASKLMLIFLSNQFLINLFFISLWSQRSRETSTIILLLTFLLIILNSFFIHYSFSKPAIKLLVRKYPYYFPKYFYQEPKPMMKVDSIKFKKIRNVGWAIMITLILVNLWILLSLFYLHLFKTQF